MNKPPTAYTTDHEPKISERTQPVFNTNLGTNHGIYFNTFIYLYLKHKYW
jgi:hypothetical protein